MNENPDRENLIRGWSKKILYELNKILPANPVEADFRHAVEPLLDEFCGEIGVNPIEHAEYTLATGRADAVFNRLVIEYERPGVLKKSLDKATTHAVQQVKGYVQGMEESRNPPPSLARYGRRRHLPRLWDYQPS